MNTSSAEIDSHERNKAFLLLFCTILVVLSPLLLEHTQTAHVRDQQQAP